MYGDIVKNTSFRDSSVDISSSPKKKSSIS